VKKKRAKYWMGRKMQKTKAAQKSRTRANLSNSKCKNNRNISL